MFTQVRSSSRRITPEAAEGRSVMRAVYVVLEPQYQNALTQAATALNASAISRSMAATSLEIIS